MSQAIATLVAVLFVAVVSLVVWLSTARKKQVEAQTATKALTEAQEVQHAGDKIMAEPVADEDAWLADLDQRLHNDRDQP